MKRTVLEADGKNVEANISLDSETGLVKLKAGSKTFNFKANDGVSSSELFVKASELLSKSGSLAMKYLDQNSLRVDDGSGAESDLTDDGDGLGEDADLNIGILWHQRVGGTGMVQGAPHDNWNVTEAVDTIKVNSYEDWKAGLKQYAYCEFTKSASTGMVVAFDNNIFPVGQWSATEKSGWYYDQDAVPTITEEESDSIDDWLSQVSGNEVEVVGGDDSSSEGHERVILARDDSGEVVGTFADDGQDQGAGFTGSDLRTNG